MGCAWMRFRSSPSAGSIVGMVPVLGQLAPPDMWFHVEFVVRDEAKGTRVQSFLNGMKVAELLDERMFFQSGGRCIRGPVGGTLQVRNLRLERLQGH